MDRRITGLLAVALLSSACGRSPLDDEDEFAFGGAGSGGVPTGGGAGGTGATGGAPLGGGGGAGGIVIGGAGGVGGTSIGGSGGVGGTSIGGSGGVGGTSIGGSGGVGGTSIGGSGGVGGTSVGGSGGIGGTGGTAIGGTGGTAVGGTGGTGVGGTGGVVGFCGDGVLGPGEQCDLGVSNADRPALRVRQGSKAAGVRPIDTPSSVQFFYNYYSASSHTGFELLATSRMALHRSVSTGALSLVVFHGIDQTTTGITQPASSVSFAFSGIPSVAVVAVADDTATEFSKTGATTAVGTWTFNANSDGGALSGLPFPGSWSIQIDAKFISGITQWQFVQNASFYPDLAMTGEPVFVEAFDSPSKCRTKCTVPKCGDFILDGGEICDDGNNVSGDGCAGDCKALK